MKKPDRILRDKQLDALEDESERCLKKLLKNVAHKHENGGFFEDNEHYTTCMEKLEDLDGTTPTTT